MPWSAWQDPYPMRTLGELSTANNYSASSVDLVEQDGQAYADALYAEVWDGARSGAGEDFSSATSQSALLQFAWRNFANLVGLGSGAGGQDVWEYGAEWRRSVARYVWRNWVDPDATRQTWPGDINPELQYGVDFLEHPTLLDPWGGALYIDHADTPNVVRTAGIRCTVGAITATRDGVPAPWDVAFDLDIFVATVAETRRQAWDAGLAAAGYTKVATVTAHVEHDTTAWITYAGDTYLADEAFEIVVPGLEDQPDALWLVSSHDLTQVDAPRPGFGAVGSDGNLINGARHDDVAALTVRPFVDYEVPAWRYWTHEMPPLRIAQRDDDTGETDATATARLDDHATSVQSSIRDGANTYV